MAACCLSCAASGKTDDGAALPRGAHYTTTEQQLQEQLPVPTRIPPPSGPVLEVPPAPATTPLWMWILLVLGIVWMLGDR